jgi:hypothetical protein
MQTGIFRKAMQGVPVTQLSAQKQQLWLFRFNKKTVRLFKKQEYTFSSC